MKGFTIVLRKRRKRHKKTKLKFIYFVPVIIVVLFTLFLTLVNKENKAENYIKLPEEIINFRSADDYAEYYLPIVVNNFFSYKKGQKTDNENLIRIAVWTVLCSEDTAKYEAFDGELVIPSDVVAEKAKQLFSSDITITNETINGEKYSIVFDKDTESYFIPTIGFTPEYTPILESSEVKKDKTILTVGCLKSENYKQDSLGNTVAPEAEKRIIITLEKGTEGYHIEEISEE